MFDAVQEIKARLQIEDVVRQYVQLKKTGRSLKGLCPFHAEKSPSFVVSPERGIAYCFGCHKGGDIFAFIQEIEGVDFVDALKLLAERSGVELERYETKKSIPKGEKDQLLHIHEIVGRFYQKHLFETDDGKKVIEYLNKRGLNDETIRSFHIGFAPDSFDMTHNMLLKEGFTKKILVQSGLALTKETTIDQIYDRFRGRLMFPIFDHMGRIVGFGGRALKKDQEPKYLNSPETAIYHKSNVLYGFSHAKPHIKEKKSVILVEGYMDMTTAFQAGLKNVVATSGTAMTVQQLRHVQPFVDTIFLAFDMDNAGQEAARRAFDLTQEFDFMVKVITLPEGKDIAEYAKTHANELPQLLEKAQTYGDYFYDKLIRTYGTEDIQNKRKILQEFYPFLSSLKSGIQKDEYVRRFALDFHLNEKQIYDEMKNFKLPLSHPARRYSGLDAPIQPKGKKFSADSLLMGFLLEFPRIAKLFQEQLTEEYFSDELKPIYKVFSDQYNGQGVQEVGAFLAILPHEQAEKASLLSLYIHEIYGEVGEEAAEQEIKVLIDKILKTVVRSKSQEIRKKIEIAEKEGKKDDYLRLLQELHDLNRQVLR
jgi:DNA primase